MKRLLPWLHAVPVVVFIGLGLLAYIWYTRTQAVHRAEERRLVATTAEAFREINKENERLQVELARRQKVVVRYIERADTQRAIRDSALATAPASAPAVCSPWITAVTACARETTLLRTAIDTLTADLDTSRTQIARNDTTIARGKRALDATKCRFPCLDLVVGAGILLDETLVVRKGLFAGLKLF